MLSQGALQAITALLGFAGLAISAYLHHKKKQMEGGVKQLLEGDCEEVIQSDHSRFLGIDVEVIGIVYYLLIGISYSLFSFTSFTAPTWYLFGIIAASIAAVIFSAYLGFLQAFTLKKWCGWCVMSAIVSVGILAASLTGSEAGLQSLMSQYQPLLVWMSMIGASIGLGGSIGFDALYLTYLRDFKLSEMQADTLDTLNHLIWAAAAIVIIGLVGTAIATPQILQQPFFQASAFILGFIILNDSIYTLYLANKMSEITFADEEENEYDQEKQTSFMMASFSTVSWTALITIQIIAPRIPVFNILALFMAMLGLIGLFSLSVDAIIERRASGDLPDWSPIH